jgi:hypothetical protein
MPLPFERAMAEPLTAFAMIGCNDEDLGAGVEPDRINATE